MGTEPRKEVYTCFIRTLSPIHIGCDEVYEPMGFTVDEKAYQLVVFDPLGFVLGMEDEGRRRFSEICLKGTVASILEIYKFLQTRKIEGRRVDVCNSFPDHYKQTLSIPLNDERRIQQELNRFSIARTAFSTEDSRPYIPGSSIKGALRTGHLNGLQQKEHLPLLKGKGAARELERQLMGHESIPTDPFRLVKVSDFRPVGEIRTKVVYAVNEKKKTSKFSARGPQQILEVIPRGSIFVGAITVERPEPKAGIRNPVSLKTLLDGSSNFYVGESARERKELDQALIADSVPKIDEEALDSGRLLRIGRHSGAESVTIDGQRQILIRQGPGKNVTLDHATTFWLSAESRAPKLKSHLSPFGWAVLSAMKDDLQEQFQEKESSWKDRSEEEKDSRRLLIQRIAAEKSEAREAARKRAEEEEGRRQEEERRKAAFEAMSPEERDIVLLSDPGVTEDQVVQLYMRLDQFSEPNRKPLATALKGYWVRVGKWAKVQKIKGILDEN